MSTLYVDNLQPNLGSQVEIPALKPLAGSVVQVVKPNITLGGTVSIGAGSSVALVDTFSITKQYASSNVLIILNLGYSNLSGTNQDDNSALFLRNERNNAYLKTRAIYNQTDAFWATDTTNYYADAGNGSNASFQYHHFELSQAFLDTSSYDGLVTYSLLANSQNSTLQIGRWFDNSVVLMEIAQ